MREPGERRSGILDFLFGEAQQAVADVRAKLIEEGWFGRRSAPSREPSLGWTRPEAPTSGHRERSFEEQWAVRSPGNDMQPPGADHDHDR